MFTGSHCHAKLNGPSTASLYEPLHEARAGTGALIDNFALLLSHGLMMLVAWRLLARPDLDDDSVPAPPPTAPRRSRWARKAGDEAGA